MDRARLKQARVGVRTANLVLMAALLAYAIAVALSGFLGRLTVPQIERLHSVALRVLLGLLVWDAGKVLGVALGAAALGRLSDITPRAGGIALTTLTYVLDLGVALLLGHARGPWTRPEALLGRAAVAVLIGWMAIGILRRLRGRSRAGGSRP